VSNSALTPRKTPRQERSRRTVDRILDAATRIFDEVGYSAATTNDIAADANISIGSLYQYFPNKDSILVALARRHIESTVAELVSVVSGLESGYLLEDVLRTVLDFLVEQHEADHLHLLIAHTAPRSHELAIELDRAKEVLVDLAVPFLADRIAAETQRLRAARMVVAIIDGAVHDVILREPRGRSRRAAVELTIAAISSAVAAASDRSSEGAARPLVEHNSLPESGRRPTEWIS
jgi:AcrR family transcriptional regulator